MLALVVLCAGAGDCGSAQFKAPTVAVYIPAGIGGGYDAYARLASRHLGRFLPGNPAIVPRNMPGAGGVVVANYLYNVAPEGRQRDRAVHGRRAVRAAVRQYAGEIRHVAIQLDHEPQPARQYRHLLAPESPVRTMQDFLKQEILVGSSGGGDSSTEAYPNLLNLLAGTKFKVVTGYKGNGEAMLAMERNEVHGIVGTELSSLRATGRTGSATRRCGSSCRSGCPKSDELPDVPSGLDLIKDEEGRRVFELLLARQEFGRPFALPPGTPPDVVATFRQAFAAMAKDEAFLKDAEKMRADIIVGSGEEVSGAVCQDLWQPEAAGRARHRDVQERFRQALVCAPRVRQHFCVAVSRNATLWRPRLRLRMLRIAMAD